jgi:hypothetical protein
MLDTIAPKDPVLTEVDTIGESDFAKVYVHKDVFHQMQAIQRSQGSPKFDLKDICSAALRIALTLPDATALIKKQVMTDFLTRRRL